MSELIQNNSDLKVLTSPDVMPAFDTLFFIALEDLDSSVILYHRGHYPQAVFYLQQTVEKAVKSLGLLFEVIMEEDLGKKIGHNPLEVYRKPINRFSDSITGLNKNLGEYPEFDEFIHSAGIDFDELSSTIKKLQHEFNEYIRTIAQFDLTTEELQNSLSKIENIKNEIESVNKRIVEYGLSEDEFTSLKGELKNQIESAFFSLRISDTRKEEMRSELQSMFKSFLPNKQFFEFFIATSMKIIGIILTLFYLSIITSPHSSRSRYYEGDFNPLAFYIPECPLIKRLPELQEITRDTLEELDEFYDLIFNLPEEPSDIPDQMKLLSAKDPGDESE